MTTQIPLFSTIEPESIVVFDFETTGMSPQDGDRVIEIGAVRLQQGAIVDQFQSLINPECDLNPFIIDLTGINNEMLQTAPPAAGVVRDFCRFVGPSPRHPWWPTTLRLINVFCWPSFSVINWMFLHLLPVQCLRLGVFFLSRPIINWAPWSTTLNCLRPVVFTGLWLMPV